MVTSEHMVPSEMIENVKLMKYIGMNDKVCHNYIT